MMPMESTASSPVALTRPPAFQLAGHPSPKLGGDLVRPPGLLGPFTQLIAQAKTKTQPSWVTRPSRAAGPAIS